ncbi:MAG: threonylcarbamoyl-AMP synthase [Clostridia bacterium]|nr:threonylcarbamoyl-AMP synthase [Clostridia bacterium]
MIWSNTYEGISEAAEALRKGNLVALPTETVYGLGADALNPDAVAAVFRAKGRPADNPLIVHIADVSEMEKYAYPNEWAYRLAEAFWPGPLTVILPKRDIIPSIVSAGLNSVALRCPAHPVARELIRVSGCPIAAPSANISGKPSGTTAEHVLHDFKERIAGVIDGGPCACGLESTVVSLLGDHPVLLRPGFVTPEQIRQVIPSLTVAKAVVEELGKDETILSPGLAHRHYAPSCETIGLIGSAEKAAEYIASQATEGPYAVMCFDGEESFFCADRIVTYGHRGAPAEQGERLFDALRFLDEASVCRIYINAECGDGVGLAVYNRLLRSCGFRMIRV